MTTLATEVAARRRLPDPAVAKAIRIAAGVSQERLARELGVHRVTIARWEVGPRAPRGQLAVQYLRALDLMRDAS